VDETLWETFDVATKAANADRSSVLRDFIRWYVHEPGTRMPKRPDKREDTP